MRIDQDQLRTLLVIVALAAIFAGAGWLPQHNKRGAIIQRITAAQTAIASDEPQSQSLDRLHGEISLLNASLLGTQDRIPSQNEVGSLLRDLSQAMTRQGLDDQQVVAHSVHPGQEFNVVPLTLQFKGGFAGIFGLLREVEAMPRLVRLTRVELTSDPGKGGEVRASVELCTFFAPRGSASDNGLVSEESSQ